jgi:hypothetical protein
MHSMKNLLLKYILLINNILICELWLDIVGASKSLLVNHFNIHNNPVMRCSNFLAWFQIQRILHQLQSSTLKFYTLYFRRSFQLLCLQASLLIPNSICHLALQLTKVVTKIDHHNFEYRDINNCYEYYSGYTDNKCNNCIFNGLFKCVVQ